MTSDAREFFLRELPHRATSRIDRAVLICAYTKIVDGKPSTNNKEIRSAFEAAHLPQPNTTDLSYLLARDPRVSTRSGVVRSLVKGDAFLRETYPELFSAEAEEEEAKLSASVKAVLGRTPFIDQNYLVDLERMLELYATLHVLENSMRRLIVAVVKKNLGADWWSVAASAPQKRKHEDRLEKERTRKWLPARSELGPLYSLDWGDLISIMRKYETLFKPVVGEIDFLHRYADLGLLRHVVAHHGFVDNQHDFERVRIALHDWQAQVGEALRRAGGS